MHFLFYPVRFFFLYQAYIRGCPSNVFGIQPHPFSLGMIIGFQMCSLAMLYNQTNEFDPFNLLPGFLGRPIKRFLRRRHRLRLSQNPSIHMYYRRHVKNERRGRQ